MVNFVVLCQCNLLANGDIKFGRCDLILSFHSELWNCVWGALGLLGWLTALYFGHNGDGLIPVFGDCPWGADSLTNIPCGRCSWNQSPFLQQKNNTEVLNTLFMFSHPDHRARIALEGKLK